MGVLQNGFRDTVGVFRTYGGTVSNNAYPYISLGNYNLTGMKRNLTAGEGITDDTVGIPIGYVDNGWQLPQKAGQLSARSDDVAFAATATGLRGMPGEGSATFAITTNAPASELIVSGSGSASFSVTTNAPLLVASLNGSGSASFAIATGTPILGAIADLTASSSFAITTNAPIIYPLDDSSPLRTGSATFAFSCSLTRYAVGHMEGSALPYTELSPQSLASAVWDSVLVDYQQDGSAGKSLSTASSGGVDLNLMAQAVWEYVSRTLTEGASPSESDIVAALQATTIPVDVRKMNGSTLLGNGTESDKWRGSGV